MKVTTIHVYTIWNILIYGLWQINSVNILVLAEQVNIQH